MHDRFVFLGVEQRSRGLAAVQTGLPGRLSARRRRSRPLAQRSTSVPPLAHGQLESCRGTGIRCSRSGWPVARSRWTGLVPQHALAVLSTSALGALPMGQDSSRSARILLDPALQASNRYTSGGSGPWDLASTTVSSSGGDPSFGSFNRSETWVTPPCPRRRSRRSATSPLGRPPAGAGRSGAGPPAPPVPPGWAVGRRLPDRGGGEVLAWPRSGLSWAF